MQYEISSGYTAYLHLKLSVSQRWTAIWLVVNSYQQTHCFEYAPEPGTETNSSSTSVTAAATVQFGAGRRITWCTEYRKITEPEAEARGNPWEAFNIGEQKPCDGPFCVPMVV